MADPVPITDETEHNFFRHDTFHDVIQLERAIEQLHGHPRYLLEDAFPNIKQCLSRLTKLLCMLQPVSPHEGQVPPGAGFFRPVEAAEYLRTSTATLARLRKRGHGPEYSKFGVRILYSKNELDKFLASQ
jgi:hypothetical protein